ncbi:MAG: family 78 glycoside hydrolase catalytic domain [Terriglobia bacterium]
MTIAENGFPSQQLHRIPKSDWFVPFLLALLLVGQGVPSLQAERAARGPSAPANLRCEYLVNPMGVDVKQPRFSWTLDHTERGQKQTALQILVSKSPELQTGDQWDSGKAESNDSSQVEYKGKPLLSGQTYYWKVRYWDAQGVVSPYSSVARFDTGLFLPEDWKGSWIGVKNQLRKEFNLSGKVVRARAYVSGLGYYELHLNGQKVGDHVLDPGWTTYTRRILYSTYDVTSLLQQGGNALGVMLGQGWYQAYAEGYPVRWKCDNCGIFRIQLNIELEGGKQIGVVSDTSWKGMDGPIVFNNIYNGEIYDARRETPGWDRPGFDDRQWAPAQSVKEPGGTLSAQLMPAIQVVDTITPLVINNPQPDVYVFDMGQNFSGWIELRVKGPRGSRVRIRHAELLFENGTLNTENLRKAQATDVYTLKGEGEEVYQPRFTYHGFRYVELTGYPGVPTLAAVRGKVVHSAVRPIGSFSCSKPILNQIQRIVTWGQKTNLHSIPTDCSQRDERQGWMGDAQVTAEEAMLNFDMAAFYSNFVRNIRDVQDEQGRITDTVPHVWGSRPADPAWGTAYPLLCWYMWENYADKRILEENYEGLKKWADFLHSASENGILKYSYYGDWVAIEKTVGSLVSTFYYYYDTDIVAKAARILGKTADAESYAQRAAQIKEAFHKAFYNPDTKTYGNDTQTAATLALYLDLVPEKERGSLQQSLTHDITYRQDTHVTTGFIGIKYLMELLPRMNRADLAYELAAQTTYPSWGYMVKNGATTLWELWQNKTGPSMNSHNHPMFGSVGIFFYRSLAGINLGKEAAGYQTIRIEPQVVRDLSYASASTETMKGLVASNWKRSTVEKTLTLEVQIPVNSEAEIVIPKLDLQKFMIREDGKLLWRDGQYVSGLSGVSGAKEMPNSFVVGVGSGHYIFQLSED